MNGFIHELWKNNGYDCGTIIGDDKKEYYFDSRSISRDNNMSDFSVEDYVQFDVVLNEKARNDKAINISILDKVKELDDSSNIGIVKFYKPGFARGHNGRNLQDEMDQHLKVGSQEDIIVKKFSKIFYVTRVDHHSFRQNSFPYCLLGATSKTKQFIRGQYEFLMIFSHFDSEDWQQITLKAEREIRKKKEVSERRPLVNFYILVSNARTFKKEIDAVKGSTSAAIIPFSFKEIIETNSTKELLALVLRRFSEYLYENNMLGETNAIDDDNLLFGDRSIIADSIVSRCRQKNNSGIFGLRRSGKTSVLNAVLRRFDRDTIKYAKFESRSELQSLSSWQLALYEMAKKIRQITLGIEQEDGETREAFNKRLKLNSTKEDYKKRPMCFIEDVKLYCKNESLFIIAIDEIELITCNTTTFDVWKNADAFSGFWGTLRDCGCPLILCGVNSSINELSQIENGIRSVDNPMYQRIINCAESSNTYLPAFTDMQTKTMLNTLGGYSNISFSNIYVDINRAFGGQPYAIRQFGSYIFTKIKPLRKIDEVYEVSKAAFDNLIKEFNSSAEGISLCKTILEHVTIYKEEYETLKRIALSPEKYRTVDAMDIFRIDHLEKYGLIEYDRSTCFVTFNILSIKDYICKTARKNPIDMTNDERREYIQKFVRNCEIKLKTYIRNYYSLTGKEDSGRSVFKGYIIKKNHLIKINRKAKPAPDPNVCLFKDFFDHNKFIIFFSTLKVIICDNWTSLGKTFSKDGISIEKFKSCMDDLNAGRTDADHYDAENTNICPESWDINDQVIRSFCAAAELFQGFFEKYGL